MHKYLSDWYRSAGIPTDNIPLAKRCEAIANFEVDGDGVGALTQIFYEMPLSDPLFEGKFRTVINKEDPNFSMSGDARELVVLAGAALVGVIENAERDLSDLATLCLICGSAQNLRGSPAVREIPELAVRHLSNRSAQRDEPGDTGDDAKLAASLVEKGEPFDALGREFQKLQLQIPVVSEEANMLWWIFGETSRDLDKRWNKMSIEEVCLISAKELADLTKVTPGPVAARAFLDRAIRSGRDSVKSSVSIADVVNKTPKDWREKNYKQPLPNELKGMLPFCEAVRYSIDASDGDGWRSIFKSATRIAAASKAEPDKIAYQIFLEHLTVRCFAEVNQ